MSILRKLLQTVKREVTNPIEKTLGINTPVKRRKKRKTKTSSRRKKKKRVSRRRRR